MWIETRYYDDGRVLAKLHTGQKVTIRDDADYDAYITTLTEEYSLEDVVAELDIYMMRSWQRTSSENYGLVSG